MNKTLLTLSLVAALTGITHAQIANGNFSNGLSGWTSLGSPTVDTSNPPTNPAVAQDADISSTDSTTTANSVEVTDIESVLGLSLPGSNLGGYSPTDGEALFQTFTIDQTATLSFEYAVTTADDEIHDETGYSITSGTAALGSSLTGGTFYATDSTGAIPMSYNTVSGVTLGPGTYTLGFESYNTEDGNYATQYLVSNVELLDGSGNPITASATPEPRSWALAVMVFAAGVGMLYHRGLVLA